MITVDQLERAGARIAAATKFRSRHEDVIQLVALLRARMHPRAVVRLPKEGSERGQLMRLHETAQPSPCRVHAVETEGANSASTTRSLRVTPEAAAADAGVAVEADHHDITRLGAGEQTSEAIVEGVMLSNNVTRSGGVRSDEEDAHLPTVLPATPAAANDETHAEETIALCMLLVASAVPCRVSSARE